MIGDFRASLYDLFGYALPGIVVLSAIYLLDGVISYSGQPIKLDPVLSSPLVWVVLVMAYFLGHAIQALGNFLKVDSEVGALGRDSKGALPAAVLDAVDRTLTQRLGSDAARLPERTKYALIDEGRALAPSTGDRDVYVYREGFYRGMVIACSTIGVVLAATAVLRPGVSMMASGHMFSINRLEAVSGTVLFLAMAAAYFVRLKRFGRYRVERAVHLWLMVSSQRKAS